MAYSSLVNEEKQDDDLTCPICRKDFADPVLIECHHSFCRACIDRLIHRDIKKSHFECPTCKISILRPPGGVFSLPGSFYIEKLKKAKSGPEPSFRMCRKHTAEDLRFYCTNCEITICRDCQVLNHRDHTIEYVADVAGKNRNILLEGVAETKKDLRKLNDARNIITNNQKTVSEIKQSAMNMLSNHAQKIKNVIDDMAQTTKEKINEHFKIYERELEKELEKADSQAAELERFKLDVTEAVEKISDHSLIRNYKTFLEKRRSIIVEGIPNKMNYKSELGTVYQKGAIDKTILESMVGTISMETKADEKTKVDVPRSQTRAKLVIIQSSNT